MSRMRVIVAVILFLSVVAGGLFLWYQSRDEAPQVAPAVETELETRKWPEVSRIGRSVEQRPIEAYTFGEGDTHLLFVGGIHGGYEWNSVLLAYEMIDYFSANRSAIPVVLKVTIIPVLNPDGLYTVLETEGRFEQSDVPADVGPPPTGRFNARGVDLNRNFDCKWQPRSTWRTETISAGTAPFSEPETVALRDFVRKELPDAVVFWHSKADAVYASECENGILNETRVVLDTYAGAADYRSVLSFDHYEVTGDAEGWLASIGIPAITVELATRDQIEWVKNLAGVRALIALYGAEQNTTQ